MAIIVERDMTRIRSVFSSEEKGIFSSDEMVFYHAETLIERGFLPEIDLSNPPTGEQFRQTLESQDVVSQAYRSVMVPDRWVDPKNTYETKFRKATVHNGFVVAVSLEAVHHDNRDFMKNYAAAAREQREEDYRTGQEHW